MKKTIALILLLSANQFFSQEKIGNKIYAYGNLENSIIGKTLIHYGVNDPKSEIKIIRSFEKLGVNAISWNKVFIPNYEYSDLDRKLEIDKNEINTVIFIKPNGTSYSTQSYLSTTYSGLTNSLNTSGSTGSVLGNMGLVFEIYNRVDKFSKPVAVVNANADNSWGAAGSQSGLALKIVDRVISAFKDQKAYHSVGNIASTEINNNKVIIDPTNTDALFRSALAKSQNGDIRGAIIDYDEIIKLENIATPTIYKMSTVYNNKAYCLVVLENYKDALPLANKALELDKNEAYIWDTRGELNYKLKQYQECIADMNNAILIKETDNSLYYRGLSEIKLGHQSKGCEDLSRSKALGNSDASKEMNKLCK
jgi:hypothetical protein